jgi:hypothetical protein
MRFAAWICVNLVFGLFPLGVTLLNHTLFATDSEVVKVEELTFFAFMLIATTLVDLVVADIKQPTAKLILSVVLLMLFVASALLYGANTFTSKIPPNARPLSVLRAMSIVLAPAVAVITIGVQTYLRINETIGTGPGQAGQGTPQSQPSPPTGGKP